MAKSKLNKAASKEDAKQSTPLEAAQQKLLDRVSKPSIDATVSATPAEKPQGNGEQGLPATVPNGNGSATGAAAGKTEMSVELAEKVKELLRLAQEQGYLTYNDINDALPENIAKAEEIDEILIKLRNLEVEIVDQAEVDRLKQP